MGRFRTGLLLTSSIALIVIGIIMLIQGSLLGLVVIFAGGVTGLIRLRKISNERKRT